MNIKLILIVLGEPNSTFSEVLFKYFNSNKYKKNKKKIILIGNVKLLKAQMKILKQKVILNKIYNVSESESKKINIINVDYNFKDAFSKIKINSNKYIEKCFDISLSIIKKNKNCVLINGPVSKKTFLNKKFLGITEYIGHKTKSKNPVMLIYNEKIAVSPLTTHVPLKNVTKLVKKRKIIKDTIKINNFYKLFFKKKPTIGVLGLNPHCETTSKISEEENEIVPAIKYLSKNKIKIDGPIPADTFFIKKNMDRFDVCIGMYHDQVLAPIKTMFEFKAVNITLGLPFLKITPDHGPNYKMLGKNKSDPSSIYYAFEIINNIK